MNKTQIGENAGIVWNILKDNKHWEYEQLKEICDDLDIDFDSYLEE